MSQSEKENRLLTAMLALFIWNPELFRFFPDPRKKQQLMLYYRAKGVVLHDRELNRENIEVNV